jgi:hypothetical protein
VSTAARGVVHVAIPAVPASARLVPMTRTCRGDRSPLGSGRAVVRRITASLPRSRYWLSAPAPAAARKVHATAAKKRRSSIGPAAARRYPAAALATDSPVTRGLMSARYPHARLPRAGRRPSDGPGLPALRGRRRDESDRPEARGPAARWESVFAFMVTTLRL